MIAEFGHFCLIMAFVMAVVLSIVPLIGVSRKNSALMQLAIPLTFGMASGVFIAFAALVNSFITSDFSLALVARHSHSTKPLIYKISGTWGNHEGSLLLWIVILVAFAAVLAWRGRTMALPLKIRTLAVQGMVSAGFLAFSLFTSNPFSRLDTPPIDGAGLNPVLQDPGLAMHPPTLYVGYVGLSLAFSLAVAGLMEGRIDRDWARHARPWISAAWCALTCGIALGSWWAYYELGWGGWWFWDPVENASLMPWLAATALLHSVIVVEARGTFKSWTVLLAILAFSLSLVGTFIVRSGLLTSVHSFASDPARGVFILGILLAAIGVPLVLFAIRGPQLSARDEPTSNEGEQDSSGFALVSRDTGLIVNNFLLTAATLVVLIGTFYPLGLEMVTGARITVGPPYFAATFNPIMAVLVFAMAIGPLLVWRRGTTPARRLAVGAAIIGGLAAMLGGVMLASGLSAGAIAAIGLVGWLGAAILGDILHRVKPWQTSGIGGKLRGIAGPVWGMWLAHLGMVVFLTGAVGNDVFQSEKIVRAMPGDVIQLAGHDITFKGVETRNGPNYVTETAVLEYRKNGRVVAIMEPEQRFYNAERQTTTEAAIRPRISGDDYAVLGDGDAARGYTLRLYQKPLVSWIWAGAGLMALGGLIAVIARARTTARISTRIRSRSQKSPIEKGAGG